MKFNRFANMLPPFLIARNIGAEAATRVAQLRFLGVATVSARHGRVLLQLDQPGGHYEPLDETDPGGARPVPVYRASDQGGHRVARCERDRELPEEEPLLLRRGGQQRQPGRCD